MFNSHLIRFGEIDNTTITFPRRNHTPDKDNKSDRRGRE